MFLGLLILRHLNIISVLPRLRFSGTDFPFLYRLFGREFLDHFWISQANHIFRQCRTITGCEDDGEESNSQQRVVPHFGQYHS
jgi:hypothetical protein